MWVFVDVDGTLIDQWDNPRPHIPEFLERLKKLNCEIVVWSAGGHDYAERKFNMICNRLQMDLRHLIRAYWWKEWRKKMVIDDVKFYVDDVKEYVEARQKEGSPAFKVPFYNDPTMVSIAEKDDKWLLRAADCVEKVHKARSR